MFGNLLKGAQGFLSNLFSSQPQPQQQVISPLPNEYSRFTQPQGFIGPIQQPQQAVQDFRSSQSQPQPRQDTLPPPGGGGEDQGQYTSFGMPGELVGALRDVNGITWQHQGGDRWVSLRQTGQDEGGIDNLVNSIVDPVSKALDSWRQKLEEFDKNNPFAFDEAQAKASAGERLNPYYNATLNEFMTGIRRSSARSVEDSQRTIGELNTDATKLSEQERLSTQEAIRQSEEGAAGAGLFFSGQRQRQSNLQDIQGTQALEAIDTRKNRGIDTANRMNLRTQEDLALQEARTKRLTEAERTTALETDVAGQKREAELRRAQERLSFTGSAPGSGGNFNLQNQIYGLY